MFFLKNTFIRSLLDCFAVVPARRSLMITYYCILLLLSPWKLRDGQAAVAKSRTKFQKQRGSDSAIARTCNAIPKTRGSFGTGSCDNVGQTRASRWKQRATETLWKCREPTISTLPPGKGKLKIARVYRAMRGNLILLVFVIAIYCYSLLFVAPYFLALSGTAPLPIFSALDAVANSI